MKFSYLLKATILVGAIVTVLAGSTRADGLQLGTETLTFVDGSTVTGNFSLTAGTNTLVGWDFTTTAGTFFPAETFNSADPNTVAPTALIVSNSNGDEVLSFEENQPVTGTREELDLVISCGGVANCLTQANTTTPMTFALTTGPQTCTGTGFCIESGLQNVPETLTSVALSPGFLNVTDPAGVFAFNISSKADGTLFNPGGTNPPPQAPEPSTILLLGAGLGAALLIKARS